MVEARLVENDPAKTSLRRRIRSMDRWGGLAGIDFLGAHILARTIRRSDLFPDTPDITGDPDDLEDVSPCAAI